MKAENLIIKTSQTIFMLACLFGIIIRFYPDGQSLWSDELYSVTNAYSWDSFKDLFFDEMIYETNPPLYQTFLYLWVKIFGGSDYAVRFPSAFFGAASIIIIIVFGKKIFGKNRALLFAALLSLSWGAILYAHEARSYSLLLMFSVILTLQSQKLISFTEENKNPNRLLLSVFFTGLLICHTHYFGALLYFSTLIALFLFLKGLRKRILFLALASILAFAPWLITNLIFYNPYKVSWITRSSALDYIISLRNKYLYNYKLSWMIAGFISILLLFQSWPSLKNIFKPILFPIAVILIGFVTALTLNFFKPIILTRYLIVFLPSACLWLAHIFSAPFISKKLNRLSFSKNVPFLFSIIVVFAMMYLSIKFFGIFERTKWKDSALSIGKIDNIDKIYCAGPKLNYYHYFRENEVISLDDFVNITQNQTSLLIEPDSGKVSVFWTATNLDLYSKVKDSLISHNFKVIDEKAFYTKTSGTSKYLVYK